MLLRRDAKRGCQSNRGIRKEVEAAGEYEFGRMCTREKEKESKGREGEREVETERERESEKM